jgi:TRAP-type mannitol/chloroaromatic compound transport system permease small subunit
VRAVVRAIEWLVDRSGQAAALIALAIIGLMVSNVVLRYTMSAGSMWAQELEWHLLAALVLLGMSYSLQRGENVRVDIFYSRFSAASKKAVDIVSAVLTILLGCLVIWLSLKYVGQSFAINEKSADPGGLPYRWALKSLIPLGYGLLVLQALGELLRTVRGWEVHAEAGEGDRARHV